MRNIKGKVITVIMLASLVVGASTGVFAADGTNSTIGTIKQDGKLDVLQTKLDSLVKDGIITLNQEIAVKTVVTSEIDKDGDNKDLLKNELDSLVAAGTITSNDETTIETAISNGKGEIKTTLDSLVSAGTITSAKEIAIENILKSQNKGEEKKVDHEDLLKSKLDSLVSTRTITANQEAAILEALTSSK